MRALLRTSLIGGLLALSGVVACSSSDEGSATDAPRPSAKAGSSGSTTGGSGGSFTATGGSSNAAGSGTSGAAGEEPIPDGVGEDGEGIGGGTAEDEGGAGGSGGADVGGSGGMAAGGASAAGGSSASGGSGGSTGAGGSGNAGSGSGGKPAGTPDCDCFLTAPTCGAAALTQAENKGCHLTIPSGGKNDVLHCPNGKAGAVAVKTTCKDGCRVVGGGAADVCELPTCPCFSTSGYCGSAVLKEAEKRGCKASIPAGSGDDVLYCPQGADGAFAVKDTCKDGCVSAPSGQVDYCKATSTPATYKLPVPCGTDAKCTNANNTNTHTGKDHYAYDFGMPVGTSIRAMRGGTVLATRMPSPPGSACYDGGGTSCANYANTVEIKHSDGTVGLYMHLSKITVKKGDVLAQGDELGKSGKSGWVTGPHLHVQVQESCGIWWCQSKPFKFGEGSVGTGTVRASGNCK